MKSQKALYPTTLSNDFLYCIERAISYCESNNLELYILYSYRLIAYNTEDNTDYQILKKEIENKAAFIFRKLEEELLSKSNIKYKLLSEVGFLNDRVTLFMRNHLVDCVILSPSNFELLKSNIQGSSPNYRLNDKPVILV